MKTSPARQPARRAEPPPGRLRAFLRRYGKTLLVVGLLVVFVHDIFGEHGFLAMRRSRREVEKLQQEIQQLHEENRRIAGEVEALKTDPQMIEKIAREEMGLAKPKEYVFKLPPAPEKAAEPEKPPR